MDPVRRFAIGATILAAILWSSGGLFYRSFYANLVFLIIFRKSLFKINRLTLISSLFYAPLLISFVTATKLTTSANAIFLQYTAPAFVLLLEPYFVRTKLNRINIYTVIACLFGMCLFFMEQFSSPKNWLGIWLALFSGLILTGLLISQKMNKPEFQTGAVFLGNVLVCIFTLPWFIDSSWPTIEEHFYLLILGFGQLGLGYALFIFGQKHLPAIESALIAMLDPILNPVWVFIGYGEHPGYWAVFGGFIIIAALTLRLFWIEFHVSPNYPK